MTAPKSDYGLAGRTPSAGQWLIDQEVRRAFCSACHGLLPILAVRGTLLRGVRATAPESGTITCSHCGKENRVTVMVHVYTEADGDDGAR